MKKLIILDSHALIHRSYHALPPFKTKKGKVVNAVYGFVSVLFKVIRELKPDYLIAAFDFPAPTFRDKEYQAYKAKRVKAPDDLYEQIPLIKEFAKVLEIPVYEAEGFEADDVIGTLVEKSGVKNVIITGDLDTLQLINKNTEVYNLKKGINQVAVYDEKAVRERYGINPEQMTDFKGLRGDPSDNIPGVPGIGEKTALNLIQRFGSLEKLYRDIDQAEINPKLKARLLEHRDQAFFSQRLATIRKDVPIDFRLKIAEWTGFNSGKAIKFLEKLEFKSLIKRLDGIK